MITLDPPASQWAHLLRRSPAWQDGSLRDEPRAAREQLGLPTDRPIVMTGHQPLFWHPGILVKFLACEQFASSARASCVWIVPDQDEVDPFHMRLPVFTNDDHLQSKLVALGATPLRGVAAASLPAQTPDEMPVTNAPEYVRAGLARVHRALGDNADQPTLAKQSQQALSVLLRPLVTSPTTLWGSELHRASCFKHMLQKMHDDPELLARTYNAAVGANPSAGVQKLIANEVNDRWELPLWRLRPNEPRRRVYAEQLDDMPPHELAPRALCMTAVARASLCDLFIHGTGGAIYDTLTEQWMLSWLGIELAPAVVATATLNLPLRDELPSQPDVLKAQSQARAALHNPALLNDDARAEAKTDCLDAIERTKRAGNDPSPHFQKLQHILADYRAHHKDQLESLAQHAAHLAQRFEERALVNDRTWPFSWYDDNQLESLKHDVALQFAGANVSA